MSTSEPIINGLPARVRYGQEVTSGLRARARIQASPPDLREELSMLRELLNDAVEAYDVTVEEAQRLGADIHRVKIAAGALVAMAIERIERVAFTQSRISSAKFMAVPDVNILIEQFVGTVDSELALRAGNLRMAGFDPQQFMQNIAGKLRELQAAQSGAAMASYGPHGYATLAEARAAADAEAAMMDDTVPNCVIEALNARDDAREDVA